MILTQQQVDRLVAGKPVQVRRLVKYTGRYCDSCGESYNINEVEAEQACWYCEEGTIITEELIPKWKEGRDYAVQLGGEKWITISSDVSDEEFLRKLKEDSQRGVKAGLWYCPKCKKALSVEKVTIERMKTEELSCDCHIGVKSHPKLRHAKSTLKYLPLHFGWQPLRIKITGIRKERLLDISEEDARKYSDYKKVAKKATLIDFYEENARKHIPRNCIIREGLAWDVMKSLEKWNPEVWVLEGVRK